mmetsp:Transcript_43107/g.125469  ORF Transcript_43107/g.125469 Transcript_43107/m.125469 type:complete len:267 (-) Transcript_43107:685-1485(-)
MPGRCDKTRQCCRRRHGTCLGFIRRHPSAGTTSQHHLRRGCSRASICPFPDVRRAAGGRILGPRWRRRSRRQILASRRCSIDFQEPISAATPLAVARAAWLGNGGRFVGRLGCSCALGAISGRPRHGRGGGGRRKQGVGQGGPCGGFRAVSGPRTIQAAVPAVAPAVTPRGADALRRCRAECASPAVNRQRGSTATAYARTSRMSRRLPRALLVHRAAPAHRQERPAASGLRVQLGAARNWKPWASVDPTRRLLQLLFLGGSSCAA